MRTTSIVAILAMSVVGWTGSAQAQGVRMIGDASQVFRLDNNFNFGGADGLEFRGYTRGNIGIESQTDTTRIFASTGLALSINPNFDLNISTPSLRFGAQTRTKLTSYVVGAAYSTGPITLEELRSDLSLARITSDQTRLSGNFAISHTLNEITRARFTGSASQLDFDVDNPELVPSADYNLGFSLYRELSDITSVELGLGAGYFEGEGLAQSESTSFRINGSINHQLDTRTQVNGNLGVAFVSTEETDGGVRGTDDIATLLIGAGVSYALPDGSINVSLSQSVGPSASGELELNTGISAAYEQQVTNVTSYGLSAAYATQSELNGDNLESIFSLSPTYSQQLTRDVEMEAAYTFSRSDGGDIAHGVSVEFSTEIDRLLR